MTEPRTYTPAGMTAQERLNTPTECGCCGRQGLKRTVKMVASDGGIVWLGSTCAARAMGIGEAQFARHTREADRAVASAAAEARRAAAAAEDALFDAYLVATTGRTDRREQIDALGGFAAARAAYKAARA